jgi:hypothetical protein
VSAWIIKSCKADWRDTQGCSHHTAQPWFIFRLSASSHYHITFLKPFRLISTIIIPQDSGMSGNPTLSPTCSLDIRIFTPATSPITRESNTTETVKQKESISLRTLYKVQGSRKDDHTTLEDRTVELTSARQSLMTITRRLPKLALNIPLAVSTPRDYDAGDTTTPPLSPESDSPGSTDKNQSRQEHLKHTLHTLTITSRRPKLALNIPTYPPRATQSPDAGETTTPPLSPQYHPETAQYLSPHDGGDFKLTRRSLSSGQGGRRKPTLINLHPYIQALIIHYLAKDEWLDKYSLRVTCRRFYSLIGPPHPDGFDRHQWSSLDGSFLSCRDCLRLRNEVEFVDLMRDGNFRPGGSAAKERYCIDCGLKEQLLAGRRIPPRLKKRTRLKVDGVEFVVCIYCGEFGQAPGREETWFMDCCRECLVDGSKWMGKLRDGATVPVSIPSILRRQERFGRVLNGSPAIVRGDVG